MSTLDTKTKDHALLKTAYVYVIVTIFCALFGAVYERFSHEIYSYYMIYAFAFPLVLGVLPSLTLDWLEKGKLLAGQGGFYYHCAVVTVTVGSIVTGVLEIYGTTNPLTKLYWVVGVGLLLAGVIMCFYDWKNENGR